MINTPYSPSAFPEEFSRILAEAAMQLPAMTRPQDMNFLEIALADVIDIFWSNYIANLSADAKTAYSAAEDEETGTALYEWQKTYANFREDPAAEKLGAQVLADIAEKLPAALKEEYENFSEVDAIV
jgi:hypothetical protein